MFKDFSQLNSVVNNAIPPERSSLMSQALELQGSILSRVRDVANEYTKAYNSVSVIKYDQDGNPVDITPQEKMSVADNRLSVVKAWISNARARLDLLRSSVGQAASVTIDPLAVLGNDPIVTIGGRSLRLSVWTGASDTGVLFEFFKMVLSQIWPEGIVERAGSSSVYFYAMVVQSPLTFPDRMSITNPGPTGSVNAKAYWKTADNKAAFKVAFDSIDRGTMEYGGSAATFNRVTFSFWYGGRQYVCYTAADEITDGMFWNRNLNNLSSVAVTDISLESFIGSDYARVVENFTEIACVRTSSLNIEANAVKIGLPPVSSGAKVYSDQPVVVPITTLSISDVLIDDAKLAQLENTL